MFCANVYAKFVSFFPDVYAETKKNSFSARALFVVCRDLMGLPIQTYQGRLMKKELSLGFSLSASFRGRLVASFICRLTLFCYDIEDGNYCHLIALHLENIPVCSTSSGPLWHLSHSVVTALTKHPCCLSFNHKLSSFINIKFEEFCSRANSCSAIFENKCQ